MQYQWISRTNPICRYYWEKFLNLIHPDDRELAQENFKSLYDSKEADSPVQYRLFAKDKSELLVELYFKPIVWGKTQLYTLLFEISTKRCR